MDIYWTNERNNMGVDTLSAILQVLYNFKMDCSGFQKFILDENEVLKLSGKTANIPNSNPGNF